MLFRSNIQFPCNARGDSKGCLIIGEVAQAHDGSLGTAHAYIDALAKAGADAVKFQTHIASAESTIEEPWRVKFSYQDASRYAYWKRMEFTETQWRVLKQHAESVGLLFLSSPFSEEAVDLLTRIGVKAWKVASGEMSNTPMLDRMVSTKLPFLVSTGMSSIHEIEAVVEKLKQEYCPLLLMQCTTAYPCPPEKIGLNLLSEYRERFNVPVGLSDHSGTIYPALAAATLAAEAIEVHVTFSRETFGPDVTASVTTAELSQLVAGIRFIEKALANPLDKDCATDDLSEIRAAFTRSVVTRHALQKGTTIQLGDLASKKPGTGIPSARLHELVGRETVRSLPVDHIILESDLRPLVKQ